MAPLPPFHYYTSSFKFSSEHWKSSDLQRFAYSPNPASRRPPLTSLHPEQIMTRKAAKSPQQADLTHRPREISRSVTPPSDFENQPRPSLSKKAAKPASTAATKPLPTSNSRPANAIDRVKQVASRIGDRIASSAAVTTSNATASKTRKRTRDFVDLSGSDDLIEDIPNNSKRIRTVAAPTKMGAMVSQLVEGYESKTAAGVANHQLPTVASRAKAKPARPSTPRLTIKRVDSVVPMQAPLPPPNKPRYFTCEKCKIMTPYDFDTHMLDDLRCGNPRCGHVCCGDCIIDGIKDICEKQEWHDTSRYESYWHWRGEDNSDE